MIQALQKVTPGQPFRGFPAVTYNALIDLLNAYRSGQFTANRVPPDTVRSSGIVECVNGSGANLSQYQVLAISAPMFVPPSATDAFKEKPTIRGVVPGTTTKFKYVIVRQPLKMNEVGLCTISGVALVRVNMAQTYHKWAHAEPGTVTRLISDWVGNAKILWTETAGGGEQWAMVLLGQLELMRMRGTADTTVQPGGSVTVTLKGGGNITDVKFDHATGNEQISAGKDVVVQYFPYEDLWAIDGAECEIIF